MTMKDGCLCLQRLPGAGRNGYDRMNRIGIDESEQQAIRKRPSMFRVILNHKQGRPE
ncbi:MAG: hypothetical protein NT047_07425 [Deltaproteobacteria bacterium]|nr:hypothetical protein [Deltaproteobacteria bacterium]